MLEFSGFLFYNINSQSLAQLTMDDLTIDPRPKSRVAFENPICVRVSALNAADQAGGKDRLNSMKRFIIFITLWILFPLPIRAESQWGLPEGARARLGKGRIQTIAYSPDGTLIAVGSSIGVWIYDAETGEELTLLRGQEARSLRVVFSPSGELLASCGGSAVYLWDVRTGRLVHKIITGAQDVAFSPNGNVLATGEWSDRSIRLWDVNTGNLLREFTGYNHSVDDVTFSPDGKTIVGMSEAQIIFWDIETAQPIRRFTLPDARFYNMALSPDFQTLAINSVKRTGDWQEGFIYEGFIDFWDVKSGRQKRRIELSVPSVYADSAYVNLIFSPDSQLLLGTEWSSSIYVWDVQTGERVDSFFAGESRGVAEGIGGWAFTPDGETLALASRGGYIELWDANTFRFLSSTNITGHPLWVYSVAFSRDGNTIASGHAGARIRLWNANTGIFQRELIGHTNNVVSVVFSPTEPILVSGSYDRTIRLWPYDKITISFAGFGGGRVINTGHLRVVNSIAMSPNGQMIASGSNDTTVRLWNVETGEHLHTFAEGNRDVQSVAFSPDGETLASSSDAVRLWNVNTGRLLHTLRKGDYFFGGYSIAFSPNGKIIASTFEHDLADDWKLPDHGIHFWDVQTGELVRTIRMSGLGSLAFSPNGKIIAGGNISGNIYLWDVQTATQLREFKGGEVTDLAFSPDGETLASSGRDGTVLLWDITPTPTPEDVNNDGVVNIQDLVIVANAIGGREPDINGDGIVNILDLIAVTNKM